MHCQATQRRRTNVRLTSHRPTTRTPPSSKRILNQAEDICPATFFAPSEPANHRIDVAGKKKGRTMNPLTQFKNVTILPVLIALTLGCFGLSPQARAVCQQGCNVLLGNTFLGDDALFSNTTGFSNTATGGQALYSFLRRAGHRARGGGGPHPGFLCIVAGAPGPRRCSLGKRTPAFLSANVIRRPD
jgi:hypothetical protein